MHDPARNRSVVVALLASLPPLVLAVLIAGLAPSGVPCGSPVHPSFWVAPCAAPAAADEDVPRVPLAWTPPDDAEARRSALTQRVAAALERCAETELPEVSGKRLLRLLVDLDLDAGRLDAALATLREGQADAEDWVRAAWRLRRGEQPERARQAFLEALRLDPENHWAHEALVELDPAAALAAFDRRAAGHDRSAVAAQRAELLLACGRRDDALAALFSVSVDESRSEMWWHQLQLLDPELARDELERTALHGTSARALKACVERLREHGDLDRALALVSRPWIHDEVREAALELLCELDPRRGEERLREELARRPESAELWERIGDSASDHGDLEGSLDAWMRALELDPSSGDHWTLWHLRRDAFLDVLRRHAERADPGDALWAWSDYGDWLWRSGRSAAARAAWQHAADLEPEAEAVRAKLARAAHGQWPL